MAQTDLTNDDEGKRVVGSNGEEIGMVTEIENDTAHVDPDPGMTDAIRSKLGWEDSDQQDYVLQGDRIGTVTDDEIRLKD